MKTFNIIDPGMNQKLGHHREINLALATELTARGYQVHIYAHKTYPVGPADIENPHIRIIPHFTVFPYAILNNHPSLSDITLRHQRCELNFYNELLSIPLAGDIHFSNTFSYQLKAIAKISTHATATACIHVHPNRYSTHGEHFWIMATSELRQHMNNFQLFTVENMLSHEIDRLTPYGHSVKTLPFPLQLPTPHPPAQATHRIGILGGLRSSQGAEKLMRSIQIIRAQGFEVLLQDAKNTIQALDGVHKIGFLERFSDAFTACDAILLNYIPEPYRFMGSGVMWEAMANGLPVLHTKGTALAHLAKKYATGIEFSYHDGDSLKKALSHYKDHTKDVHSQAKHAALKIRSEHSIVRHVDHLV